MHPLYPNTLVWLDLPVRNLDRAIAFYQKVLGFPVKDLRPEQAMAVIVQPNGGVSCSLLLTAEPPATGRYPLPYFNCQRRLKQAVSRVTEQGGTVEQDIRELTPFGNCAIIIDSEGNRIALHSPESS